MKHMHGKVSVVTPFYNRFPIVKETYSSLTGQVYDNWEWVIVDDGSDADQILELRNLVSTDSRVKIYNRRDFSKHKGANAARNVGFYQASGDYIIFLDSDDVLSPICLRDRAAFLDTNLDLDFAVFQSAIFYKEIDDDGRLLVSYIDKSRHLNLFLKLDAIWWTSSPAWRRKALVEKGLTWSEEIRGYQDVDFHIRAILIGLNYRLVNCKPDSFWRWGMTGNISHNLSKPDLAESHIKLWSGVAALMSEKHRDSPDNLAPIRRHLCELVLYPVRQYNFVLAKTHLEMLHQTGILRVADLKLLAKMISFRGYPWPLSIILTGLLYRIYFKSFHTYSNSYFGISKLNETT